MVYRQSGTVGGNHALVIRNKTDQKTSLSVNSRSRLMLLAGQSLQKTVIVLHRADIGLHPFIRDKDIALPMVRAVRV